MTAAPSLIAKLLVCAPHDASAVVKSSASRTLSPRQAKLGVVLESVSAAATRATAMIERRIYSPDSDSDIRRMPDKRQDNGFNSCPKTNNTGRGARARKRR